MQKVRRRLRRHKAVVVAVGACAIVMLVSAVVSLALSNLRIAREEAQTRQALADVEMQRQRADANFRKAQAAVDVMLTAISENRLFDTPELTPLRRQVLEKR